jgi:hypothetical protein
LKGCELLKELCYKTNPISVTTSIKTVPFPMAAVTGDKWSAGIVSGWQLMVDYKIL